MGLAQQVALQQDTCKDIKDIKDMCKQEIICKELLRTSHCSEPSEQNFERSEFPKDC